MKLIAILAANKPKPNTHQLLGDRFEQWFRDILTGSE